jgi:hypothetical protein
MINSQIKTFQIVLDAQGFASAQLSLPYIVRKMEIISAVYSEAVPIQTYGIVRSNLVDNGTLAIVYRDSTLAPNISQSGMVFEFEPLKYVNDTYTFQMLNMDRSTPANCNTDIITIVTRFYYQEE